MPARLHTDAHAYAYACGLCGLIRARLRKGFCGHRVFQQGEPLPGWGLRLAQRRIERRHAQVHRGLLKVDHDTGRLLAFSGRPE